LEAFRPLAGVPRRDDMLLTTMSADSPLKGFRFLLEALEILRRQHPRLSLTVIGQPGTDTETEGRVRALGLADVVRFTGRLTTEEMVELYAQATVAVVPSLYEGFGFPAGEAMAAGVAVVSTRGGALPEVVGEAGTCGVLVEPGSGAALAAGIESLLRDCNRRAALGVAGRRRVQDLFTWRRATERTVAAYREAIAEGRGSSHAHRTV
jgi:glycosyltransferase involved in cell wall biosynthesis